LSPGNIFAQYQIFRAKSSYTIGLNYLINNIHLPYIFGQYDYAFNEKFQLTGIIGFGGYGQANAGLGLSYFTDAVLITIGSQNLEGIILPNSFGGNNFYANLKFLLP
jgi:hypothetical protein